MTRRSGTTLIEVLIAIFVMAIGLIALLTLFPIGALRMATAIQDNNCAIAVANANAVATMKNIRNDPSVKSPAWFAPNSTPVDVFKDAALRNSGRRAADPDGPSYPVFVDPIGARNSFGPAQWWLAGTGFAPNKGYIARTSTSFTPFTPTNPETFRWFALVDDYVFDTDENSTGSGGKPFNYNINARGVPQYPAIIRRNIPYTWAYLLQRPRSSDPSIVTCSVVVYNKRPLGLSGLALAEVAYNATFSTSANTITVIYGTAAAPNARAGDWILDCTKVEGRTYGSAHGYFYRIVGVNQFSNAAVAFEVQQPIRGFSGSSSSSYPGGVIFLEGVADVYDRGLDRKPN